MNEAAPIVFAEPDYPFWGFGEVLMLFALALVAILLVGAASHALLPAQMERGAFAVAEEFVIYGLVFTALKILFMRHGKPLLRSLGWIRTGFSLSQLAATGIVLALTVILLQRFILRTPDIETPFEKMLADPLSRIVIALFGVTLAPIVEELLFRGFLQPVLIEAAGVFPGILITSLLFGAIHLSQNAGLWQSGLLIALVGFTLGVIRHISGSTRASAVGHIAYNFLPCIALLSQGLPSHHK